MLEKAQRILEKHPLCNNCLGRQFALLGYGVDNEKRGEALKLLLTMKAHQLALSKEKNGFTLDPSLEPTLTLMDFNNIIEIDLEKNCIENGLRNLELITAVGFKDGEIFITLHLV